MKLRFILASLLLFSLSGCLTFWKQPLYPGHPLAGAELCALNGTWLTEGNGKSAILLIDPKTKYLTMVGEDRIDIFRYEISKWHDQIYISVANGKTHVAIEAGKITTKGKLDHGYAVALLELSGPNHLSAYWPNKDDIRALLKNPKVRNSFWLGNDLDQDYSVNFIDMDKLSPSERDSVHLRKGERIFTGQRYRPANASTPKPDC